MDRSQKFKQAAFFYLHVGILYEMAVWAVWRAGRMPAVPGGVLLWLGVGAAIVALVFWLLWFRQSVWTARVVWAIHALRIPSLIENAFLRDPARDIMIIPPGFYMVALLIVLLNLWMLARAGWDL